MGVTGLLPFVKPSLRRCNLSEFRGFVVAIDASCWLMQAVAVNPFSGFVVNVFMTRLEKIQKADVIPIFVFDGSTPTSKAKETARRDKQNGSNTTVNRQHRRTIVRDIIKLLRKVGVSYINAPYEADTQIAFLLKMNIAQVAVTEDSDFIINECDMVIFKLDWEGNGDLYTKQDFLKQLEFEDKRFPIQFIRWVAIVSGTDYFKTKGVGFATAKQLLHKGYTDDISVFKNRVRKLLGSKVSDWEEYFKDFDRAENTFKYQLVFDISRRKLTPLNPYPSDKSHYDYPFAGAMLDDKFALALAGGNVDIDKMTIDNKISLAEPPAFTNIPSNQDLFFLNFKQIDKITQLDLSKMKKRVAEKYECYKCEVQFDLLTDFAKHLRDRTAHPEQVPSSSRWVCSFCLNSYSNVCHFASHLRYRCAKRNGVIRPEFRCDNCFKTLRSKHRLKIHNEFTCPILHPTIYQKRFLCLNCDSKFNTKEAQKAHIFTCGFVPPNKEDKSDIKIIQVVSNNLFTTNTVNENKTLKKAVKSLNCPLCSYIAKDNHCYKIHLKIHDPNREREFSCPECESNFYQKCTLNSHLRKLHGINTEVKNYGRQGTNKKVSNPNKHQTQSYFCNKCQIGFTRNSNLKEHLIRLHSVNPTKHTCTKCKKSFAGKSELRRHDRNLHGKRKDYPCQHCGSIFISERKLEIHQTAHCRKKPKSKPMKIEKCDRPNAKFKPNVPLQQSSSINDDIPWIQQQLLEKEELCRHLMNEV